MRWDIFCKVIDNHGDLGVAWRLASQLATRGQQVRLWVDEPDALAWIAPGACEGGVAGVTVRRWTRPLQPDPAQSGDPIGRSDVWLETFGCDIDPDFIAIQTLLTLDQGQKGMKNPVWINLEYLSAESYVERCHGLPSPVMQGPAKGMTRHFFYPGFTAQTGGLLCEPSLAADQAAFEKNDWLRGIGVEAGDERLVSLFCYEPEPLGPWLEQLAHGSRPTRLLVTPGRAAAAVRTHFSENNGINPGSNGHGMLLISYLPTLPQREFDRLLWACDLNFVRGEDSLVRAIWAGQPFVWHIYPQDDGAHVPKLLAFLDWLQAPPSLRSFHRIWNGCGAHSDGTTLPEPDMDTWRRCVQQARERLLAQPDLVTALLGFVGERR
ncbi:MAG: elongation factor P maturation arginine rhamnosyltransferase EarP [Burkholderiaceae bacterium]|nr:elongation factor P maturation arginine rhamnosyltransferase EarP [Burkholderiaceae bacterium]